MRLDQMERKRGLLIMNPVGVIKKILQLVKKLKNPPFFYYSVYHYMKKDVPISRAKNFWLKNSRSYMKEEKEFIVPTYDGSNQSVHPDMVFFKGKYWLVVTPYPYGMEEYENPCIYCGESIFRLFQNKGNPIDCQRKREIGFHLSDPCIFEYKDTLVCAYRENIRYSSNANCFIYFKVLDSNGSWQNRCLITESNKDPLLSPAFYVEEIAGYETVNMIHVNCSGNDSFLVHSMLDDQFNVLSTRIQKCEGIPDGFFIWHISVSYSEGRKKGGCKDAKHGLFLLRHKNRNHLFKLFYVIKQENANWKCIKEIVPGDAVKRIQLHPYKAAFVPKSNVIIYSYVDVYNRYRITLLDDL